MFRKRQVGSRERHHRTPKLKMVLAMNWEGLYVDGKLYDEGRHVNIVAALKSLGIIDIPEQWVDEQWIATTHTLPDSFEDVELEPTEK